MYIDIGFTATPLYEWKEYTKANTLNRMRVPFKKSWPMKLNCRKFYLHSMNCEIVISKNSLHLKAAIVTI